jgi:flagellar FliJ protein
VGRPFKLEAVLNHRLHREEVARKRYADAVRELRRQQDRLTQIEITRREYREALRRKQSDGYAVAEIILYARYLTRLDTEIQTQAEVVRKHMKAKEKERQLLMTALKERKVIEKLKEHYVRQMEIEERGREQKLINDVAISRYQRAGKEL